MTKASRIRTAAPAAVSSKVVVTIALTTAPLLGLVSACGASKPEATSVPAESASAAPADSPPTTVDASAGPPGALVPSSEPNPSAAQPAAPAKANDGIPEPKDECTPVGADFEKRARPKLRECYATGKKKDPNLEGTVKIKVTVDVKGKIKSTKIVEKTLPAPVADCMLKVVKATPFPEVDKCWDATLTIPITFPTPR